MEVMVVQIQVEVEVEEIGLADKVDQVAPVL
jgi:hypothetical protein